MADAKYGRRSGSSERRLVTGRALQARRERLWAANPRCARCGQLLEFSAIPGRGFEVDHKVSLENDGPDTDENCQLLCVPKCHEEKTAEERGYTLRTRTEPGPDGWPIERTDHARCST